MDEFDALAAALGAGIADLRGCLILSRDGLVLGGHPDGAETAVKAAWMRFAALDEPERGFVQYGREVWSYVRRGPYAAFAVTGPGVRPGLVIDQMEQVLLTAEEGRSRREGLNVSTPVLAAPSPAQALPKKKKRAALHRDSMPVEEPVVIRAESTVPADASSATGPEPPRPSAAEDPPGPPDETRPPETALPEPPRTDDEGAWATGEEGEEVDRFSLAREFSQLLQDERDDADG